MWLSLIYASYFSIFNIHVRCCRGKFQRSDFLCKVRIQSMCIKFNSLIDALIIFLICITVYFRNNFGNQIFVFVFHILYFTKGPYLIVKNYFPFLQYPYLWSTYEYGYYILCIEASNCRYTQPYAANSFLSAPSL